MVRIFSVKFERRNLFDGGNNYDIVANNARDAIEKALEREGKNSYNVHRIESVKLLVEAQ